MGFLEKAEPSKRAGYIKRLNVITYLGLVLGLLMFVGGIVLMLALGENENIGLFPGILITALGIGWGTAGMASDIVRKKMLGKYCKFCGASLKGCAYEWVEVRQRDASSLKDILKSIGGKKSEETIRVSDVKFTATCPSCNKKQDFKKSFKLLNYETMEVYNVEEKVEEFCKKTFGH